MTIELTEDEVELIIDSLRLMWRMAISKETSDASSDLGWKLQQVLIEYRKTLDNDQKIVYNENS